MPIALRVPRNGCEMTYSKFFIPVSDFGTGELQSVVYKYGVWDSDLADDVPLDKGLDSGAGDPCKGFCLYPLGEVICCNFQVFSVSLSLFKRPNQVDAQLHERPRPCQIIKFFCMYMVHRCICLTLVATLGCLGAPTIQSHNL